MNLMQGEVSPLARLKAAKRQGTEAHPLQFDDRVTDGSAHKAYLPFAPFVDGHAEPRVVLELARFLDFGRGGLFALDFDAFSEFFKCLSIRFAAHQRSILFFHAELRMSQAES